jgi:hypothetical protein
VDSLLENRKPDLSEFSDVIYLGTKRPREINASRELCNFEVSENGEFSVTSARVRGVRARREGRFINAKNSETQN